MVSFSGDHDPSFLLAKCKAVYAKMLPSIKRHARIAFRFLNPEEKEEHVQNVLANTWEALVRLAQRGKLDQAFPSILAKFAEKQTRDHRITGGHLDVKDVLSKYCQDRKGITVERLDRHDKDDENTWCEVLVEDRRAGPAEIACTRIDFESWLHSLPCRHRRLAQFLSLGNRTSDAAKKFRVSAGRVSQVRRELAESWKSFVGDDDLASSVPA